MGKLYTADSFVTIGGTTAQYVTGAGTLVAFPTIPSGTDYIQNQIASAQSANMWISGNAIVNGNVGINTSIPETRLQIEDITKVLTNNVAGVAQGTLSLVSTDALAADIGPSLIFGGNFITGNSTRIAYAGITGRKANSATTDADGYLSFLTWRSTGLTEAMRITPNGNVGVGTTTPLLAVSGRGNVTINGSSQSVLTLGVGDVWKGYLYSDGTNVDLSSSGSLIFGVSGGSEAMRINTSGHLGIGTTSPGVRFVNATAPLADTPTLGSGTVGANAILSANSLYGLYTGVSSNGNVWQQVQRNDSNTNVYSLLLNPFGGNIGIGTTSPGAILDVNGDSLINGLTVGRGGGNIGTNSVLGYQALFQNTEADQNTAIGYQTLYNSKTLYNVYVSGSYTACDDYADGEYYGIDIGNGVEIDIFINYPDEGGIYSIGVSSAPANTYIDFTGYVSTSIIGGSCDLEVFISTNILQPSSNTGIGYQALFNNNYGSGNTAIGTNSLRSNLAGNNNIAIGKNSLYSNYQGNSNIAIGENASVSRYGGFYNIAIGNNALFFDFQGNYNTAVGQNALYYNINSSYNTAIGFESLFNNTTAQENTAVGSWAMRQNTTGVGNLAVGHQALYNNTVAGYNTAIGQRSLVFVSSGDSNVALGKEAGSYISGGGTALVQATTSVFIGANSRALANSQGNQIVIGFLATGNGTNTITMGNTSIVNAYVKVAWTITSDKRDKTNFDVVPYGLDFVSKLKPTSYQFKESRDSEEVSGNIRYGFLAQDILELEGENSVIIESKDSENLKYNESSLIPVLVNAIQELKAEIELLKSKIK